jgi:hypothetical protein
MAEVHAGDGAPDVSDLLRRLPLLRVWRLLRAEDEEDLPRRSFIVEFAGMPKAGKSSVIEGVRHFFSHGHRQRQPENDLLDLRYQVHTPAEGVSLRTPAMLRENSFDFNTWAGAYGLQELIRAGHDGYNDLAVLDRGPWDAGCWLEYWRDVRPHPPEEVQKLIDYFHLSSWMIRADLHVVLLVDPDQAAKREKADRLIDHGGFTSNSDGMKRLKEIYESRYEELLQAKATDCGHVGNLAAIKVDTTDRTRKDAAALIVDAILNVLNAKVDHRARDFWLSEVAVSNQLDHYLARMNKEAKKQALEHIRANLVPPLNALSPSRRLLASLHLKEIAMPEAFVEARVPLNEFIKNLDELVKTVTQY